MDCRCLRTLNASFLVSDELPHGVKTFKVVDDFGDETSWPQFNKSTLIVQCEDPTMKLWKEHTPSGRTWTEIRAKKIGVFLFVRLNSYEALGGNYRCDAIG